MSYISEIYKRADIRQIREFLKSGSAEIINDNLTYEERVNVSCSEMMNILNKAYPVIEERDKMYSYVHNYAATCEDVHMEIGIQVGILLMTQMIQNISNQH